MNPPLTYSPKHPSPNIGGYRYFFNRQEGDNEVFGEVANFGYEFRQYDSRLARWWSVDPKWSEYPSVSPFVFCNGNPINRVDPKGSADDWIYNLKTNRYTWDSNVTSPENTPEGYKYVGQTKQDISNHFKQHNPVTFIFRNPQFEENRTPYNGEISTPKLVSRMEIWLSSPSANIGQGIVKAVSNFAYSIFNSPYSLLTGNSIAGSKLESSQKTDAFMDFAPSLFPTGMFVTKSVVKTSGGLRGLDKFNDFVRKSPGITSSEGLPSNMKWQKHAGRLYQINKKNYKLIQQYGFTERSGDAIKAVSDELNKQ